MRRPMLFFDRGPCMVLRVVAVQAAREVPGGLPPPGLRLLEPKKPSCTMNVVCTKHGDTNAS
jgi:hypothetical protein